MGLLQFLVSFDLVCFQHLSCDFVWAYPPSNMWYRSDNDLPQVFKLGRRVTEGTEHELVRPCGAFLVGELSHQFRQGTRGCSHMIHIDTI